MTDDDKPEGAEEDSEAEPPRVSFADLEARVFAPLRAVSERLNADLSKRLGLNLTGLRPFNRLIPLFTVPPAVSRGRFSEAVLAPLPKPLLAIDWSALAPKIDPELLRSVARLIERHLPPNWKDVHWTTAAEFVGESGWPIVWLPRADIVSELLASSPDDRAAVLVNRRVEVIDDAATVLADVRWDELDYLRGCAEDVVAAMRDGHDRPAQAFAASILTGLLQGTLEYGTLKEARDAFEGDWRDQDMYLFRYAVITSTIPKALGRFFPHEGDPIPRTFNRHALAHIRHPDQLTEINALSGLMLITALLRELQELKDAGYLSEAGAEDGSSN